MRVCAVTGASGYVGSRVAARLEAAGWSVRPLGRAQGFSLGAGAPDGAFDGVDALVHAAWDFDARSEAEIERVNVDGSRSLLEQARAAGIERVCFVSTLSAFPGARSLYGRAKLAVEERTRELGGTIVRPGLVWGDEGGSLHGTLRRLARSAPLLPVFSDRKLHLAHEDDLGDAVARLLDEPSVEPVVAAAPQPLTLAEILRAEAARAGRRARIVHVPWRLVWAPLRALELVRLRPPFRSDSVVSLVSLDERPFEHGASPPTSFRPYA